MGRREVRVLAVVLLVGSITFMVAWANAHGIDGLAVGAGAGSVGSVCSWLFRGAGKDSGK